MRIFIDTSAFLALEFKTDRHHLVARQFFTHLKSQRALFYTNNYVLAETYTRFIYDLHLKAAQKFQEYILQLATLNQLIIIEVTSEDSEQVWAGLERYSDHKLSFTDGTVVASFKKYHLDQIFTFDKHFKEINLPTNLG